MAYNKNLVYGVATIYYIDQFIQEKIARRLDISRYSVSRILKKARNEKIMQIKIIESKN